MNSEFLFAKVNAALLTVLIVSSPALIAAVLVGQDQTLPQAVKLIVVLVIMILFGRVLAQQVVDQAAMALDEFPAMTH
jgi:type III secretion protein S